MADRPYPSPRWLSVIRRLIAKREATTDVVPMPPSVPREFGRVHALACCCAGCN